MTSWSISLSRLRSATTFRSLLFSSSSHLSGGTGYLADPIAPLQVKALQEAAPSQSMTLQIQDIRTADDISVAFEVGI